MTGSPDATATPTGTDPESTAGHARVSVGTLTAMVVGGMVGAGVFSLPTTMPVRVVTLTRPAPSTRVRGGGQRRYSGFSQSKRSPSSHAERWLPYAGIPPASRSSLARWSRFHVMNVVLRFVKSFSGPPLSSSR